LCFPGYLVLPSLLYVKESSRKEEGKLLTQCLEGPLLLLEDSMTTPAPRSTHAFPGPSAALYDSLLCCFKDGFHNWCWVLEKLQSSLSPVRWDEACSLTFLFAHSHHCAFGDKPASLGEVCLSRSRLERRTCPSLNFLRTSYFKAGYRLASHGTCLISPGHTIFSFLGTLSVCLLSASFPWNTVTHSLVTSQALWLTSQHSLHIYATLPPRLWALWRWGSCVKLFCILLLHPIRQALRSR
jgi:hypothetical protein